MALIFLSKVECNIRAILANEVCFGYYPTVMLENLQKDVKYIVINQLEIFLILKIQPSCHILQVNFCVCEAFSLKKSILSSLYHMRLNRSISSLPRLHIV